MTNDAVSVTLPRSSWNHVINALRANGYRVMAGVVKQQVDSSKPADLYIPDFYEITVGPIFMRGWYWYDVACEEPMGPFCSRAAAEHDRKGVR